MTAIWTIDEAEVDRLLAGLMGELYAACPVATPEEKKELLARAAAERVPLIGLRVTMAGRVVAEVSPTLRRDLAAIVFGGSR